MQRKKIGETLIDGKSGKLEYVLAIKVKSKEDGNTFFWGIFPSKRKAINHTKRIKSKYFKMGSESFDCWVIYERIKGSDSVENSNRYDSDGNEICNKGAILR
jgi:hypothetical protein